MPSIIESMRRQKAVWWQRTTADSYGKFSFADPVEVKCRWEDVATENRGPTGEIFVSKSTVYVDRPMKEGDFLMLGELDSTTPANPNDAEDAEQIVVFEKLPDLKNRHTLYTAKL